MSLLPLRSRGRQSQRERDASPFRTRRERVKTKDINEAKDPALRGSLAALVRASQQARQTAIQTGTDLIIVKDGKLVRISPEELRREVETKDDATS